MCFTILTFFSKVRLDVECGDAERRAPEVAAAKKVVDTSPCPAHLYSCTAPKHGTYPEIQAQTRPISAPNTRTISTATPHIRGDTRMCALSVRITHRVWRNPGFPRV